MKALLVATALANVTGGFAMYVVVLLSQGASRPMDAFLAVQAIAQVLLSVLVGSAVNVVVPIMSAQNFMPDRGRLAAGFCAWTALLTVGLALPSWLAAPIWVPVLLPGFEGTDLELAVSLARVASIGLVVSALASCLMATCQARGKNLAAESLQVLATLTALGAASLLVPRHGVIAAAWILVGRALLSATLLLPLAGLARGTFWWGEHLREALRRLLPLIVGTMSFKVAPLVDANLASRGSAGEFTMLNLIFQVFSAIATVFQQSIVAPTIGKLAYLHSRERGGEFQREVKRVLWLALGCGVIVCAVGLAAMGPAFANANLLLPAGAGIDPARARLLMLCSSGLFVAGFVGQVAAAVFYAQGDTRFPVMVGAIGFITGSATKIAGFVALGVPGIALGMSLYQVQNAVWLAHRALRSRCIDSDASREPVA